MQGSRRAPEPWPGRDVLTPWARSPTERRTSATPRADAGWSEQVLHQGWGPGADRRAAARRGPPDIDDESYDESFEDPDDWVPRRSPGAGFVLGLLGILAYVLSATVLPWVDTDTGRTVTLPDIRAAFDDRSVSVVDARGDLSPSRSPDLATPAEGSAGLSTGDAAAAGLTPGDPAAGTGTGLPTDDPATGTGIPTDDPATGTGTPADSGTAGAGIPTDDPVAGTGTPGGSGTAGVDTSTGDASASGLPDAGTPTGAGSGDGVPEAEASATQRDLDRLQAALPAVTADGRHDLIRWYSEPMWFASLVLATLAVAFATALVPASRGRRVLTGTVLAGPVGLLANLADRRGAIGPRVSGLVAASLALAMHVAAVRDLDAASGASEAALGPVVGAGALAVVALACLVGARAERPLADG